MVVAVRSVAAVLAGLGTAGAIVFVATWVALALMLEPPREGTPPLTTPAYITVNIAYSVIAAALAGYVTARIARRRLMMHARILAFLLLLPVLTTGGQPAPGQPAWYPWIIGLLGALGALAGGHIRLFEVQRSERI